MRKALVYLLLMATMLPSISPWGTIAYYQLNKDYIAKVLCENRNKPQLHCDGQCYLAKQLKAQQDKQDKETAERVQNTPSYQLFWDDSSPFTFLVGESVSLHPKSIFFYTQGAYSVALAPLFHPPGGHC